MNRVTIDPSYRQKAELSKEAIAGKVRAQPSNDGEYLHGIPASGRNIL